MQLQMQMRKKERMRGWQKRKFAGSRIELEEGC